MPFDAVAFDDRARVAALRRYGVLDDPDVTDLDALARVARTVCGTELAAVNLVDAETSVIPCYPGLAPMEVPREYTLCEPSIRTGTLAYAEDVNQDERWADHPLVVAEASLIRTHAAAPVITPDGHTIGTVCVSDSHVVPLRPDQLDALQDLADAAMHLIENRQRSARLRAAVGELAVMAAHDALTGVASRQQVLDVLGELQLEGKPHTVLYLDLDRFKLVNDEHGHVIGDRVLEAVGARLRSACRAGDVVGRLGGDEFVVVAHETRPSAVASIAERIRDLVEVEILTAAGEMHVGASVGWAVAEPDEDPTALLARADRSMYEVKDLRTR